ncbi:DUF664 domain-containing protein, partial [Brevibacterium sp. UCMA 11754]|nr:DUF664 domain-containing protein [Brevibacterium sp. UCMA 11754]
MPFFAPSVTTEADAQFSFLEQQCSQLKITALGLTDEQARSTPTVSGLSISGLLTHAAQVLFSWIQQVRDPSLEVTANDYADYNRRLGLDGMFDGSVLPDLDIADVVTAFETAMTEIDVARRGGRRERDRSVHGRPDASQSVDAQGLHHERPVDPGPSQHRDRPPCRSCGHHPRVHRWRDRISAQCPGR